METHKLMAIESALAGIGDLPTMTPEKIKALTQELVEVDRANQSLGRSKTQHSQQLQTLTMVSSSPYRRIRQCLSEIENRRQALESTGKRYRKTQKQIRKWQEKGDEESLDKIEQVLYNQERSKQYVEGALKEMAVYVAAMKDIKKTHNIPDGWTEEDAEKDEPRHHLWQAFMQSYRDMMMHGRISQGNAEYLTSYGAHLQVAKRLIENYIVKCEAMIDEGELPTVSHLFEFLDNMVAMFLDSHKLVAEHIGLSSIIRKDFLYLGEGKDDGDNTVQSD